MVRTSSVTVTTPFSELPFGAKPDFRATILGDHPELGAPRIYLQCRRLICESDKLVGCIGGPQGKQGGIDRDDRLTHFTRPKLDVGLAKQECQGLREARCAEHD
jgi:hypothetical protein